eukprot:gene760-403_t
MCISLCSEEKTAATNKYVKIDVYPTSVRQKPNDAGCGSCFERTLFNISHVYRVSCTAIPLPFESFFSARIFENFPFGPSQVDSTDTSFCLRSFLFSTTCRTAAPMSAPRVALQRLLSENVLQLRSVPVPGLAATAQRYVDSLRAVKAIEAIPVHQAKLDAFLETAGRALQKQLEDGERECAGYAGRVLLDAQQRSRRPLEVERNPGVVLKKDCLEGCTDGTQAGVAAALIHGVACWIRDAVRDGFGRSLVPSREKDTVQTMALEQLRHVIVLHDGHANLVRVLDDAGQRVEERRVIQRALEVILSTTPDEDNPAPVSVLTAGSRGLWGQAYGELVKTPENAETLRLFQEGILVVCLDSKSWAAEDGADVRGAAVLHGGQEEVENRWYDKHQVIVSADGQVGFNFESTASWMPHWCRWVEDVLAAARAGDGAGSSGSAADAAAVSTLLRPLVVTYGKSFASHIRTARQEALALVSSAEGRGVSLPVGSKELSCVGVSGDAFIQLALHLAHHRRRGCLCPTSRVVSLCGFYGGLTDIARTATLEALQMCEAFKQNVKPGKGAASTTKREEVCAMVRSAAARHEEVIRAAAGGEGVDRHIRILQRLAEKSHNEVGLSFFADPLYQTSTRFLMNTTELSRPWVRLVSVGPSDSRGCGIGYTIDTSQTRLHVVTAANSPLCSCDEQSQSIVTAAMDLYRILGGMSINAVSGAFPSAEPKNRLEKNFYDRYYYYYYYFAPSLFSVPVFIEERDGSRGVFMGSHHNEMVIARSRTAALEWNATIRMPKYCRMSDEDEDCNTSKSYSALSFSLCSFPVTLIIIIIIIISKQRLYVTVWTLARPFGGSHCSYPVRTLHCYSFLGVGLPQQTLSYGSLHLQRTKRRTGVRIIFIYSPVPQHIAGKTMASLDQDKSRMVEVLSRQEGPIDHKLLREQLQMSVEHFGAVIRDLLEKNRIVVSRTGAGLVVSLSTQGLSDNFAAVLEEVQRSGTSGIDQASLSAKLRLPKTEVAKALHSLAAQRYIQERRSFTNRAKKVYLLFNLEPSVSVTGGAFYCGEELDVGFVDNIRHLLVSFVYQKRSVAMQEIQDFIASVGGAAQEVRTGGPSSASAAPHLDLRHYCASPVSIVSSSNPATAVNLPAGAPKPPAEQLGVSVVAAANSLVSKRLGSRDIEILTRSLVLDGVLDESASSHGTMRYQLAIGKNAMRHFSASSVHPAAARAQFPPLRDLEDLAAKRGREPEASVAKRRCAEQRVAETVGSMVPSPLSQPSADPAWSYMPAVGFPCLGCPQLAACHADGVVNPHDCAYVREWLRN